MTVWGVLTRGKMARGDGAVRWNLCLLMLGGCVRTRASLHHVHLVQGGRWWRVPGDSDSVGPRVEGPCQQDEREVKECM